MGDELGKGLSPGARHYRAFVGNPEAYDILGAHQFNLLTLLGLREHHSLIDIGCGSLRAGRLFLPYLLPGNYCGVDPERWLVEEATRKELGDGLIELKRPQFSYDSDFDFGVFQRKFDYLLAQSIFTHASLAQIGRCMNSARNVMHEDSIFVASFMEGSSDHRGTEWSYPSCVEYTMATMKASARECSLRLIPLGFPHPAGVSWVLLLPI